MVLNILINDIGFIITGVLNILLTQMKSRPQSRLLQEFPSIRLDYDFQMYPPLSFSQNRSQSKSRNKTHRPLPSKGLLKPKQTSSNKKYLKKRKTPTPYRKMHQLTPALITQPITFTEEQEVTVKFTRTRNPSPEKQQDYKHARRSCEAAIKIQRAWRNYLTKKIICKYFKTQSLYSNNHLQDKIQHFRKTQQKRVSLIESNINAYIDTMKYALQQNNLKQNYSEEQTPKSTSPKSILQKTFKRYNQSQDRCKNYSHSQNKSKNQSHSIQKIDNTEDNKLQNMNPINNKSISPKLKAYSPFSIPISPISIEYTTIPSTMKSLLSSGVKMSPQRYEIITQAYNQVRDYAFGVQLQWVQWIKKKNKLPHEHTGSSIKLRKCFSVGSIVEKCIIQQAKQIQSRILEQNNFITASKQHQVPIEERYPHSPMSKQQKRIYQSNAHQSNVQAYTSNAQAYVVRNSDNVNFNTIDNCNKQQSSHLALKKKINEVQQLCNSAVSIEYQSQKSSQVQEVDDVFQKYPSNEFDVSHQKSCQVQYQKINKLSEQIQSFIESKLLTQFFCDVLTNTNLFLWIKPYIDKPFFFKRIQDSNIEVFLNQITNKYISISQCTANMNQKINPTSFQILRLIRDSDYEIEEYDLVLDEQVFKRYRKDLQLQYSVQIERENALSKEDVMIMNTEGMSLESLAIQTLQSKVKDMNRERHVRNARYLSFERDLKIMYTKAVFNSLNENIIEIKAIYPYSNIRPLTGELSLALREFNYSCREKEALKIVKGAVESIIKGLKSKNKLCIGDLEEHRWVNYMDQVLEIWVDLCKCIFDQIIAEFLNQL